MSPMHPGFQPMDTFQTAAKGGRTQAERSDLHDLQRQILKFRAAEKPRICGERY